MSGDGSGGAATADRRPVLEMRNVSTHYGLVAVLRGVNVEIFAGEMVCLLGGNASGKTTTLKTILGYVKPSEGDVLLDGVVVTGLPTMELVARGVSMVPENRRLFANMTVAENLELGGYLRKDKDKLAADREQVFQTFPRVRERLKQKTAYEMRESDWSSDVCSSDLAWPPPSRGYTRSSPCCSSAAAKRRGRCRAVSSRWWRWGGPS